MNQSSLSGQAILVTGASSGIGEAIARAVAACGARLVLAARRTDRLETLVADLQRAHGTECHALPLDVRDAGAVASAIASLPSGFTDLDVLVNNAGLARGLSPAYEQSPEDIDDMVDTNVKGLLYVTRAVVPGMVARGRGHVINLGSTSGHGVYPGGAVYCGTKHAVRAITEGLKMDVHGTAVRVTTVDPGMVETDFSLVRFRGDAERAAAVYADTTPLTAADVADAVLFALTRPPHVNISEILLMATVQSSPTMIARG